MNFVKNLIYGNKINELLKNGNEQFEDENYFSAITFFSHALDIDKHSAQALFNRGKSYLKVNNYEKALLDFESLERLNPDYDSHIFYFLSKIHLHEKNSTKSAYYAEKYNEANSENPQAQYFNARSKYFNQEYDDALKLTDLLLTKEIEDFNIRYLRSLILFAQNNFSNSILEIDKAIEIDSLNGFAFNLRGLINIQLLNYKEAIEDFDYAIRLSPANSSYFFNKAKTQLKIGDLIDAKSSINNAIDLDPENKSSFLLKAQIDLLSENHSETLESYIQAFNLDKTDIKLLKQIVGLKIYLLDFEGAKSDLQMILKIDENDAETFYKIAFLEFKLGNEEKALSYLETAIEKNPKYKDAILQKGILEYWTKNYDESLKMFDTLFKIDPSIEKAIYYKVRALLKLGYLDEATEELNNIDENKRGNEYFILNSQINLMKNNISDAESNIDRTDVNETGDESLKLIQSVLKAQQGKLDEINELHEFQFDGENKKNIQILNAVVNFEKDQYNSAKYRFSNIAGLTEHQKNEIKPFIEYSENRITK